jgi:MFS family permease
MHSGGPLGQLGVSPPPVHMPGIHHLPMTPGRVGSAMSTIASTFTLGMTLAFPCSSAFMMFALERFGRIRTAVTAFVLAGLFAAAFASAHSEAMILAVGFVILISPEAT